MNSQDSVMIDQLWVLFHEEPEWFITLGEKLQLLKNGEWSQSLIDCVYQYDWHHKPDIYDLYFFLQLYCLLRGKNASIGVFQIPICSVPFPDKNIRENNEALENLPAPFKGSFWGGNQGADGNIRWEIPIHCTKYVEDESGEGSVQWCLIEPNIAQLEVGYNSAGKFNRGIEANGLYARWPYGQEFITIFVDFNIVRIYPADHPDFDAVLKKSGETIKLAKQRERSPWERW